MKKTKDKDIEEKKPRSIKKMIIIGILLIIGCLLWARFVSTRGLVVDEYAITTTKLDAKYDGLKIVHFSDLHYGSTIRIKELENVVNKINKQKPDIIVFTGDLVENHVELSDKEIKDVIKILKKLKPSVQTFAVKGNHDYDHAYWDLIVDKLDWQILDNTYEYFYKDSSVPIIFIGLDDLTEGTPDYNNAFSYIKETNEDYYKIVLLHEPDQIDKISNYSFDLALAGHSHLGQVRFPGIGALYTPIGSKKYYDAHYKVNEAHLYINGGIGTSVLKLRFFNKPRINLYRFYTK